METLKGVSFSQLPFQSHSHFHQGVRGGKFIPLKEVVDDAVKMAPSIEKVFVMDRTGAVNLSSPKDVPLESVGIENLSCAADPI